MNEYEERKQAKHDRFVELEEKARKESEAAYNNSNAAVAGIPFGQPILVGHHSEGRHRRAIAQSHSRMRKSIKLTEKAEHYKNKAENMLNNHAISSDDPEAITKLKNKLDFLEEKRARIKQQPHESWQLSNVGAEIRLVKLRITHLEKQKTVATSEEVINGITVKINTEINRVQLLFPDIPDCVTRTKLKHNGFRWSPRNQAWQRMINNYAIYIAKDIATGCVIES